eukprot:scaffold2895_cov279-Chaetoceros_neogracile.AAC.3
MKVLTLASALAIPLLQGHVDAFATISQTVSFPILPASPNACSKATNTALQASSTEPRSIPESYPVVRKKLIQRARELDPNLQAGKSTGSYSNIGWSNRLGTVLTPAAIPGVYTACRPFLWNDIDVGCRMTVIELTSQTNGKPDLFIHSPVLLDNPLREAIEKLGTVKHIISPNYEHLKFAKMWADGFPEANMWACPGLMEREAGRWTGEIPYRARPASYPGNNPSPVEGMWDWNEVQPLHFDTEVNPFTNKPFFNEVVFFHAPSKTLMATDTYWNYPKSDGVTNSNYQDMKNFESDDFGAWELAPSLDRIPLGSRLWKKGMDKLFRPFYMNLMVKNDKKEEFRKLTSFVCGIGEKSWDVETVIPAHGDVVRGSNLPKDVLKQHFNL